MKAEQCIPVWWFRLTNRDYQSLAAGVGFNLNSLGSLSFLMSHDLMLGYNQDKETGYSYRANYSKRFESR